MKTAVLVCALFASHTLAAICPANAGNCESFLNEADCTAGYVPDLNPAGSGKACAWYTAFPPAKCIPSSTCTITSSAPATPSPPTAHPTAHPTSRPTAHPTATPTTPAPPTATPATPSPHGPTPKPTSKKDNKDYVIIIVIVAVLVVIGLAVVAFVWHRRRRSRYVAIN
eukprot:Rhum_TRINITY_DN5934_c0_g1::Rhum_TRINITY_DN5934_c0_g1_i1::g.18686::m.18686